MPVRSETRRRLVRLFRRSPVADLPALKRAPGTTVFRALSDVGYTTSYGCRSFRTTLRRHGGEALCVA